MSPLLLAFAGLSAGGLHVLAGPDHLAAVAPLAADSSRRRWLAGMLWGIGHTGGVVLVAAVAFVARGWLDIGAVSSWSCQLWKPAGFAANARSASSLDDAAATRA